MDLDPGQVERLCETALSEPDRHAALRFLHSAIPEVESALPGLRNEGLLATHELKVGVPNREEWAGAVQKAKGVLHLRGEDLVRALGYEVERLPGPATVLLAQGTKRAVAIFLDRSESIDVASEHYSGISPVSYGLTQADREGLDYVLVSSGSVLRLYSTKPPSVPAAGGGRKPL